MINNKNSFILAVNNMSKSDTNPVYSEYVSSDNFVTIDGDDLDRTSEGSLFDIYGSHIIVPLDNFEEFSSRFHHILVYADGKLLSSSDYILMTPDIAYMLVNEKYASESVIVEVHKVETTILNETFIPTVTNSYSTEIAIRTPETTNILKDTVNWIRSLEDIMLVELGPNGTRIPFYDFNVHYKFHTNDEFYIRLREGLLVIAGYSLTSNEIPYDIFHNYEKFLRLECTATVEDPNLYDEMMRYMHNIEYDTAVVQVNNFNANANKEFVIMNKNSLYDVDDTFSKLNVKSQVGALDHYDNLFDKHVAINLDQKAVSKRLFTYYKLPDSPNFTSSEECEVYINGIYQVPNIDYHFKFQDSSLMFIKALTLGDKIRVVKTLNVMKNAVYRNQDLTNSNIYGYMYSTHEYYRNISTSSLDSAPDYNFNEYGVFVIHAPYPIVRNTQIRVFNDGKKVRSEDITFLAANICYIPGITSSRNVVIKTYRAENQSFLKDRRITDPNESYSGTFADNVNLERVSDINLEMNGEWIENTISESSSERSIVLKKHLSEYIIDESDIQDKLNGYMDDDYLIPYVASNKSDTFHDPNLKRAIFNDFNQYNVDPKRSLVDYNTNYVDINDLHAYFVRFNLDLSDYRIKDLTGLEYLNYYYIYMNGTRDHYTIDLSSNNVETLDHLLFKNLPVYYNIDPDGGNDRLFKVDLTDNDLTKPTQYLLRKHYDEVGKVVDFDDDLEVFPDEVLRSSINNWMVDSYIDNGLINNAHIDLNRSKNGGIDNVSSFKMTSSNMSYIKRFHKYLSLTDFDDRSINKYGVTYDSTRIITKINTSEEIDNTISSLTGINQCINLVELIVPDQNIEEVEDLSALSLLTHIDLSNNDIDDVTFVSSNDGLESVLLGGNGFTTYDFSENGSLKYVDVSNSSFGTLDLNGDTDLMVFHGFNHIVELDASYTDVRNIEMMFHISSLEVLKVAGCSLTSNPAAPIKVPEYYLQDRAETILRYIDLSNNSLGGLDMIANMDSLEYIIAQNAAPSLGTLEMSWNNLIELVVGGCGLTEIEAVSGCSSMNLKTLSIIGSEIQSLSDLEVFWNKDVIESFILTGSLIVSEITEQHFIDMFNKNTEIDLTDNDLTSAVQELLARLVSEGWNIKFLGDKIYTAYPDNVGVGINDPLSVSYTPPVSKTMSIPRIIVDDLYVEDEWVEVSENLSVEDIYYSTTENPTLIVTDEYSEAVSVPIEIEYGGGQTYYNIGEVVEIGATGKFTPFNFDASGELLALSLPDPGLMAIYLYEDAASDTGAITNESDTSVEYGVFDGVTRGIGDAETVHDGVTLSIQAHVITGDILDASTKTIVSKILSTGNREFAIYAYEDDLKVLLYDALDVQVLTTLSGILAVNTYYNIYVNFNGNTQVLTVTINGTVTTYNLAISTIQQSTAKLYISGRNDSTSLQWIGIMYYINVNDVSIFDFKNNAGTTTLENIGTGADITLVDANLDEFWGDLSAQLVESTCGTFDGVTYATTDSFTTPDTNVVPFKILVKPSGIKTHGLLNFHNPSGDNRAIAFYSSLNVLRLYVSADGDSEDVIILGTLIVDEWNYIEGLFDNGEITWSFNGIEQTYTSSKTSINNTTLPIYIGALNGGVQIFEGLIAICKIWDYEFTFSEGAGTTLCNKGLGSDATLVNMPDGFWDDETQDVFHPNYRYGFSEVRRATGTNYIDTLIIPEADTKMEVVAKLNTVTANSGIFGRNQAGIVNTRYYVGVNDGKFTLGYGSISYVGHGTVVADTDLHTFLVEGGILYVDGVMSVDHSAATWSTAETTYTNKISNVDGLAAGDVMVYSIKVDDVEMIGAESATNQYDEPLRPDKVKIPAQVANPTLDVFGHVLTNPPAIGLNGCESKIKFPDIFGEYQEDTLVSSLNGNMNLLWENGHLRDGSVTSQNLDSSVTEVPGGGILIVAPEGDDCGVYLDANIIVGKTYNYHVELTMDGEGLDFYESGLNVALLTSGTHTGSFTATSSGSRLTFWNKGELVAAVISRVVIWESGIIPPLNHDEFVKDANHQIYACVKEELNRGVVVVYDTLNDPTQDYLVTEWYEEQGCLDIVLDNGVVVTDDGYTVVEI